jgi:hypothetical protein
MEGFYLIRLKGSPHEKRETEVASVIMNTIAQFLLKRRWQAATTASCVVFGIIFILNVHPIGDGLWFWYAVLLHNGQLLYANMHLPLQPLFVLLTAWTQDLLGKGWLASKGLAVAQLSTYCAGIFLISNFIPWKGWQNSLVIASVFGMTLGAFYFRFDDYHVTGYCLELFSIYFLLRLNRDPTDRRLFSTAALLGLMSGLSMSNRLNDGASLLVGCGLVLFFLARGRRILALSVFFIASALAILTVVLLTGDSIHDWVLNSILRASAIKGGTGHILDAPFTFPSAVIKNLGTRRTLCDVVYICLLGLFAATMSRINRRGIVPKWAARIALGIGLILPMLPNADRIMHVGSPFEQLANIGILASIGIGVAVLVRMFRAFAMNKIWNPLESLLLIPFLQLWAGAMTSGQTVLEAYPAVAVLLLLLPLFIPIPKKATWQKAAYLTVAGLIVLSAFIHKVREPYGWHHFRDQAFFVDREWYRHPVYGPMYIERDQLRFMRSICTDMSKDGPPQELLSITNPYANYFCDVTPWHGYVQTWYDTTSKQTIDTLIGELKTAPPQWIVYQRGLDTMVAHELVFTDGHPLPHRALDWLIMDRIIEGRWVVVRREVFQDADWILIRTRP